MGHFLRGEQADGGPQKRAWIEPEKAGKGIVFFLLPVLYCLLMTPERLIKRRGLSVESRKSAG